MNKTIAIYFSNPHPMGYPFDLLHYLETYNWLVKDMEALGAKAYIVRGASYQGKGVFSHGWEFVDDKLVEVNESIHATVIYNKGKGSALSTVKDCKIINHAELDDMCVDKIRTVETFPSISPATFIANSYEEYQNLSQDFGEEEYVVLKKNYLAGGDGIYILPKNMVNESLYNDWSDLLIQEFLDSEVGIPGIVEGLHDLRVTLVNGEPTNALIRIPQEGKLLANISQGGTGITIHLSQVPQEVFELLKVIDDKLAKFSPSIYAADFMNTSKGYRLIELNSRPGLLHPEYTDTWKDFNDAVVKLLVEEA
jgi:glutathione synthase/RimK-type ligase-like ATP-grasp enzyme